MTKSFIILSLLLLQSLFVFAQTRAITDQGDEVVLYSDGTWQYINENVEEVDIEVNAKPFKKPSSSGFEIKSKNVDMGFWIDPAKWSFHGSENNEDSEYELELKGQDLYAMIITEKVEIPLTTLRTVALENAMDVSPDVQIAEQEYRTVNGQTVLFMQMNGTLDGIKFSYYGYYFSYEGGTVQFIAYTSQNLLASYRKECEDLLNGMMMR